jgi:hypothetical protein
LKNSSNARCSLARILVTNARSASYTLENPSHYSQGCELRRHSSHKSIACRNGEIFGGPRRLITRQYDV